MSDPVYALATPVGRSAVAVVRVSGDPLPEKLIEALSLKKRREVFF